MSSIYSSVDLNSVDLFLDVVGPHVKWHSNTDMEHKVSYIDALKTNGEDWHDRIPRIGFEQAMDIGSNPSEFPFSL